MKTPLHVMLQKCWHYGTEAGIHEYHCHHPEGKSCLGIDLNPQAALCGWDDQNLVCTIWCQFLYGHYAERVAGAMCRQ